MIEAIIFDLGGVYFSAGTEIAYKRLIKAFPELSKETIYSIIRTGNIARDYRLGLCTKKEFWKKAQNLAGVKIDTKKFSYIWNSCYTLNKNIEKLVLRLRKNYKIAALSGNTRERVEFLDNKYHFKKNFDVLVFSYMIQTNKPDPIAYKSVLKKLGLKSEQCLMIEDTKERAKAAEKLGMKAILYKNNLQLKTELIKLRIIC
jgi:HAD superfamily hydrolase (TIGR01509 family)